MALLRTPEGQKKYKDLIDQGILEKGCALCLSESIKTFTHWKIMPNAFPYDRIAKVHDMIVPLRHSIEDDLTVEELKELHEIKNSYIQKEYEFIIEATYKVKSIPAHFHLHLLIIKDFEDEKSNFV
ncbi:MAG: hypothetical protein WCK46_02540 [Candidatus Adlerbacteria bacterium]